MQCKAWHGFFFTPTLYFIENIEDEIFQLPLVDMEEIALKVSQ